ncbi:hypothetical protein HLB23_14290 [Nocardia uniformis]|uniref:Uncharacterized protein n=1 Tax=Nocardia uniformis TaxID=53432 RepID=A0A849C812_9NOCA|nr:hypothetical protein [Nocardia uniformis]NNH71019.1 hypothetical protein [Nocardia uniformis]
MTVHRSRDLLVKFHTEALAARENTPNTLQAPITPAFAERLQSMTLRTNKRYLTRRDVYAVLAAGVTASVPGTRHYIQVFTRLYRGWSTTLNTSAHAERDRRTGRAPFQATRVTIITRRPTT